MEIMSEKERTPTNLELFFIDQKDLEEMTSNEAFHNFVKKEAYESIKYALENDLETISVFNLWNLGYLVNINKKDFKVILEGVLTFYETEEDYDECSTITKLINKL